MVLINIIKFQSRYFGTSNCFKEYDEEISELEYFYNQEVGDLYIEYTIGGKSLRQGEILLDTETERLKCIYLSEKVMMFVAGDNLEKKIIFEQVK